MTPSEFTPEITSDLYNTLSKRISQRGVTTAGQARSEMLARGLGGDPSEASAVGIARNNTNNELDSLDANLNYNVAGLQREDRIHQGDQDFSAAESAKDRDFRERMARMGYDWQGDQANTANRRSQQAALWQIPLGAAAKAGGAYFGGL